MEHNPDTPTSLALRRSPSHRLQAMARSIERRRLEGEDLPDVLLDVERDVLAELHRRRKAGFTR